jgi:hypothetical protein
VSSGHGFQNTVTGDESGRNNGKFTLSNGCAKRQYLYMVIKEFQDKKKQNERSFKGAPLLYDQ